MLLCGPLVSHALFPMSDMSRCESTNFEMSSECTMDFENLRHIGYMCVTAKTVEVLKIRCELVSVVCLSCCRHKMRAAMINIHSVVFWNTRYHIYFGIISIAAYCVHHICDSTQILLTCSGIQLRMGYSTR